MKQYNGKTFLFSSGTLILLLVLVLMTSCAPTAKKRDTINPIADAKALGNALGCVFGGCKTKEQLEQEQNQITKEFNRLDAQEKADRDKAQPASK